MNFPDTTIQELQYSDGLIAQWLWHKEQHQPLLWHTRQEMFGCLWHAAYACTGEPVFLLHTDELSNERFLVLAAHYGWLERNWWNMAHTENPCDWEALASTIPASSMNGLGYRRFYCAWRTGKMLHAFGLLFPSNPEYPHFVSDSLRQGIAVSKNRDDFKKSPYARAFLVSELLQADLDLYPRKTARDLEQV